MTKHQAHCYRIIGGVRYTNYADLIYSDAENQKVIEEARAQFKNIKIITHWTKEYRQLFVA